MTQAFQVDYQTNPSQYKHIHLAFDGEIATLSININEDAGIRPGYKLTLNSYDLGVDIELHDALQRIRFEHPEVRSVVVTSLKDRVFCSGANIFMLGVSTHGWKVNFCKFTNETRNGLEDSSKHSGPKFLAAVNGACAGLGMVMALYADMRFASDAAVFTTAFSRRGLIAEHGISWLLPRLVGMAHAADLLFSARKVRAPEALAMGLVSRVIPLADFEAEVMDYARMLATEVSPRSLGEIKREIWAAQFQGLGEAIDAANADMQGSFISEDFKEGVAHFVEKRAPAFTGR
eukprot:gene14684-31219_t